MNVRVPVVDHHSAGSSREDLDVHVSAGREDPAVTSDIRLGQDLIATLCPRTNTSRVLVIDGAPKSKARPRLGRRGVYSPSAPFEDAIAWRFRASPAWRTRFEGNVAIGAIFFRPNRQRIDVDNLLKLLLDAGTKAGLWDDDSQVTALLGIVELDAVRPRTIVAMGEHISTLRRPSAVLTCQRCEREFPASPGHHGQKYCSTACRGSALRQEKVRPGQGRGPKNQPARRCRDCGAELSKRSYIRCRACWTKARKDGVS